jgi:hypothetical protein
MSKKRLSAKNILILSGTTAGLGVSISLSLSYIMNWETGWTIALVNTIANTPLLLASSNALRQELGLRSPIQIIGSNNKNTFGRKIPINVDGKQGNIFMQTLSLAPGIADQYKPVTIDTVSIWYEENEYTLTISELEEFIYVAWRRQGQKKNGLSRQYWTKRRRPRRLKTLEYNIRIWTLTSCSGLIVDRSEGRSGRLTVSPDEAIKIIRSVY